MRSVIIPLDHSRSNMGEIMRIVLLSCLLFAVSGMSVEAITSFPDGEFSGDGHWSDNYGNEGYYEANIAFIDNTLHAEYIWEEGGVSLEYTFLFDDQGWFDVIYEGEVAGEGFCTLTQCQYQLELGEILYGETIVFSPDSIFIAGYRQEGDNFARYEQTLFLYSSSEPDFDDEPVVEEPVPGDLLPVVPVPVHDAPIEQVPPGHEYEIPVLKP